MLHASTKKLIDRLAEMTELAKLDWTESDDGTITYSTEGYSVSLTEAPYEMVITSKDGKELERASAEQLAGTQTDDGGSYAAIVAAMTSEAARVARGTETAISTLLAGMQEEAPAEDITAIDDPMTDDETGGEFQEDLADETGVLTDDSVEAVSVDTEPTEKATDGDSSDPAEAPDAVDVAAEPETSEPETAHAETEESAASEEDTELAAAAPIAEEEDTAPDMVETTSETEPESEDHVTEAVARLADEVNQRDETPLDTAAASAVGAVALAAGLSQDSDDSEPAQDEVEAVETEAAPVIAAAEEAESEPAPYVPFGLEATEDTADLNSVDEIVVAETEASDQVEVEEVSAFSFAAPVETEASAPAEPEAETISEPEPAPEPEAVGVTTTTWGSTAAEETQPLELAPEPEEAAEPAVETPDLAVASAAATEFEPEAEIAEETIEPVVTDEPIAPVAAETAPAEPQSYSLSGIGAGFGLGALSAKTEASGVPGPTGAGSAEEEKVVIDATEDVLPEIDGKPALPAGVAPIASSISVDNPSDPSATPQDAEGESDILKPRTRFNPWD